MSLPPDITTLSEPVEQPTNPGAGLSDRLSGKHTAYSATLLLMGSSVLSGLLGLVRVKYIAHVFGAGSATDAYNAAFNLPDMINYFLVGGVASITLISILNRHREAGDEVGADRALSVVLVAMTVVLGMGILLAEIFAPAYTHLFFGKLDPDTSDLCTHLTRILLPAQFFFFAGGVLGSRLLVRKIFIYQAVTPILYNLGIILGGVFLSRRVGIDSLAIGVLAGALVGSLIPNAVGAFRSGLRFYPILNLRHPAFVEWLRLSLPLMVGVSLAMADKWILSHYAAGDKGAITLLTNAKNLFNSPLSVIGVAAGAASLPFFSSLYAQNRTGDFNEAVSRAVSRLIAVALLVTAWMVALAVPIVDLLRGGMFSHDDALATARYFAIFAFSMALWSAQGIYARAFYAARNTLTPAISGTVVTCVSIPVYALLFRHLGVSGLAIASDIGIFAHTLALALLLHRYRLVRLTSLNFGELGRAGVATIVSFLATAACVRGIAAPIANLLAADTWIRPLHWLHLSNGHAGDLVLLMVGTMVWIAVAGFMLLATGSKLPRQILRRR